MLDLRIKRFLGTPENAVKTRVWIAISVYVLIAIIKKSLDIDAGLYKILQVLSVTVFEKTPLLQLLSEAERTDQTTSLTPSVTSGLRAGSSPVSGSER